MRENAHLRSKPPRRAVALLAGWALLVSSSVCAASLPFPKELKAHWAITRLPPSAGQDGCLLCHTKDSGGVGTATRAFAQKLRTKYDLAAGDLASLDSALDRIRKNADDSDHDGFSDYDEIAVHQTNPNDIASLPAPIESDGGAGGVSSLGSDGPAAAAGAGNIIEPDPSQCTPAEISFPSMAYGCQIGSRSPGSVAALSLALAALSAVSRRRRRERATRVAQ
jgi:uncharacterized protein (TIGR03382 family)